MKKPFLTVLSLLLLSTFTFATTPPASVLKAFKHKFPKATGVKWDKENKHEYEASFKINHTKFGAIYSDKGAWLQTESPYSFKQLPVAVQQTYTRDHQHETVKLVSKIEQAHGVIKYEIEIKQGLKIVEYFYTADGFTTKE